MNTEQTVQIVQPHISANQQYGTAYLNIELVPIPHSYQIVHRTDQKDKGQRTQAECHTARLRYQMSDQLALGKNKRHTYGKRNREDNAWSKGKTS